MPNAVHWQCALSQKSFSGACGSKKNIALGNLDIRCFALGEALVVVVGSDRQRFFGVLLSGVVVVKESDDVLRCFAGVRCRWRGIKHGRRVRPRRP